MLYRAIVSAVLLTACAVTQSFSGDYNNDVLIRDQYIAKAKEVTTSNIDDYVNRANTGDTNAQMALAYALTDVSDIPKDPARALQFVMMAAEENNPFAQAIIIYFINRYSIKTMSREYAFESALESANKGNVFGIINSGTAYMLGNGVEVNLKNAYELLTSAFTLGHPDATSRLCFLSDLGSKRGDSVLVEKLNEHRKLSHYDCDKVSSNAKDINKVSIVVSNSIESDKQHLQPDPVSIKTEDKKIMQVQDVPIPALKTEEELKAQETDSIVVSHPIESNTQHSQPDSVSPKIEDTKIMQVQEIKHPIPILKTEVEPKAKKHESLISVKSKAKKGKAVAKVSRSAKVNDKHKRRTKAKSGRHRVVSSKVAEEKTVAESPGMVAEKRAWLASVPVEEGSKVTPTVGENHPKVAEEPQQENTTLLKDKVEPLAKPKPVQALLQVGQALPNFSITSESGQTVALEDYRGDVLLIEFSETGCQSCRSYLPNLNELDSKFGKQGLQIIGMSIDQNPMTTKYPLVHADETIKAAFGIQDVPVFFVVDAHGRVAGVFKGISHQTHGRIEKLIIDLLRDIHKTPA